MLWSTLPAQIRSVATQTAAVLCLFLLACAEQSGAKPSARPTPSPVERPVERIVSLSPAATEALFAVGCGKKLVLRDAWSDWPVEAKQVPAVAGFSPSAEAILASRPDLVLVHFPPSNLRQALDGAQIRWLAFAPQSLEAVAESLQTIGKACGQPAAGQQAAGKLRQEIAQVQKAVSGQPKVRVFYEMDASDPNKPYTVASGSFGHDVLETAGGSNVFGAASVPWLQVTTEAVLQADPDLIVLADSDAELQPQTPAMVAARPGWSALRAVQSRAVVSVPGNLLGRPGPRIGAGLRILAAKLHPSLAPVLEAQP